MFIRQETQDLDTIGVSADSLKIFEHPDSESNKATVVNELKLLCEDTVLKMWIMTAKCHYVMFKCIIQFRNKFPDYTQIEIPNIQRALIRNREFKEVKTSDPTAVDEAAQKLLNETVDRQFEDQIKVSMDRLEAYTISH